MSHCSSRVSSSGVARSAGLRSSLAIGAALALTACGPSASPQAPKPRAVGDLGVDLAGLEAKLPPFIESVGAADPTLAFSGYVLVAQHDQPIFSESYGFADRGRKLPNTADTSFRVGSVTKQFTAAAILRLEQDGKLAVTDPISKHLPEYPAPGKDITIHQLLTHTSGLPNFTSDPAILLRKAERFTPASLLALFWDKPLDFAPGSAFAYSNSGYAVLGAIIEKASGKTYAAYLADTLFTPAGMTRTIVGDAESASDRAEGYQVQGGAITAADPIDMSLPYAAGAVRSTANDLVRWHRALSGDLILGAAARAKLYKAEKNGYAYGWVVQDVEGKHAVWHNGGIDGFSTTYWRVPDSDVVVVAWSNLLESPADPVGRAAVEAVLGGSPKPIAKVEVGKVDPAVVARVVGEYAITEESKAALLEKKIPQAILDSIVTLAIGPSPVGISMKPAGQPAVEMVPTTDGAFYVAAHQARLRYTLPASGNVVEVSLEQGPLVIKYRRSK